MTSEKMEEDVSKRHVVIGIHCKQTQTQTHTERSDQWSAMILH